VVSISWWQASIHPGCQMTWQICDSRLATRKTIKHAPEKNHKKTETPKTTKTLSQNELAWCPSPRPPNPMLKRKTFDIRRPAWMQDPSTLHWGQRGDAHGMSLYREVFIRGGCSEAPTPRKIAKAWPPQARGGTGPIPELEELLDLLRNHLGLT